MMFIYIGNNRYMVIKEDPESCLADITPPGFSLIHNSPLSGWGGGVAFVVTNMFSVQVF